VAGIAAERDDILTEIEVPEYQWVITEMTKIENGGDSFIQNQIIAMKHDDLEQMANHLSTASQRRDVQVVISNISSYLSDEVRTLHNRIVKDRKAIELLNKQLAISFYRNYAPPDTKQVAYSTFIGEVYTNLEAKALKKAIDEGIKRNKEMEEQRKKDEEQQKRNYELLQQGKKEDEEQKKKRTRSRRKKRTMKKNWCP
jgi:hypothetical protein